ncbi:hypothetical protein DCCM_2880 [Desulfocucumis palustris]|uniref:LysM domain-containing protein n=1 Tax=Desulfocucumis palustris TaxID=1898651 RepID=A0A2L2XCA3_9FIRM|nr:LysM peptidoglycan-binding domain-containing protein [Desulfocucumis palustris]GBF33770.1 hypothetical protein DCCM_2880 [Desulfocucumis palustris]
MEKPGTQKGEFKVEGRTVREIENYLAAKPSNYSGKILKTLLIFLVAGVILILPGSLIWNLRQDSAALRSQVAVLQEENDMLKKQLAGRMPPVNTVQPKDETQPRNSGENFGNSVSAAGTARNGQAAPKETANNSDPSGLQPGGYINHRVQSGESLSHISKRYYNSIRYSEYLAKVNGISVNSQLSVGQIIKVPGNPDKSQIN